MDMNDAHRPWPIPAKPWAMQMTWHDVLFMHWPIPVGDLQPLIPPGMTLDTFDGQAWIAVVPFHMSGIRARELPAIPGLSAMPELNVRTYVTVGDKPGVYFFSLDAGSKAAVFMARMTFHLPYFYARMKVDVNDQGVEYQSRRLYRQMQAEFVGAYAPAGDIYASRAGDIDHWLTERYCLYTTDPKGRVYRGEIQHAPWPLQPARAEIKVNTMVVPLALELPDLPPLLHFARHLDVVAWRLDPVA